MMAKVQQDLKAIGVELELEPIEFAQWVEQILSDDGIPVTAVYFAPDHTDTSQYVQYFGMIDGRLVVRALRPRRAEPGRDGHVRRGAGRDG